MMACKEDGKVSRCSERKARAFAWLVVLVCVWCIALPGTASAGAVQPTNSFANLYGVQSLSTGSTIAIYDPGGALCGATTVANANSWGIVPCYGDDSTTIADEGAQAGDLLSFKVDRIAASTVAVKHNRAAVAGSTPILWADRDDWELRLLAPPSDLSVLAAPTVLPVGAPLALSGSFDDPNLDDSHSGRIAWADSVVSTWNLAANARTFSRGHTYSSTGTYTVTTTITDTAGLAVTHTVAVDVVRASTAVTVTSAPRPSVNGQTVGFTATVGVVAPGAGSPTGSIQFRANGATIGAPVTLVAGSAYLDVSSLSTGSYSIAAEYSGDTNFANSSGFLSGGQIVNKANAVATLDGPAGAVGLGQHEVVTAQVAALAPGAGTPSGVVAFWEGSTLLGTQAVDVAGVARQSTASLAVGTHVIEARYAGDANFNAAKSSSFTVTVEPQEVGGWVFIDLNGDGQRSASEQDGMPGVWMSLQQGGAEVQGLRTIPAGGWYQFVEVPAGSYCLTAQIPAGWIATSPATVCFDVLPLTDVLASFGVMRASTATPTPTPTSTPSPTATATPTATSTSTPTITPTLTSTATPTMTVTLTPTPTATEGVPPGTPTPAQSTVEGWICQDQDRDGTCASGETPLAGWTVSLSGSTTRLAGAWTIETDAGGWYRFFDVPPGAYQLAVVRKPGYWATGAIAVVVSPALHETVILETGFFWPPEHKYAPWLRR